MNGDLTPRPTVYNGIRMRSRLEAGFAAWCDQRQISWQYEPLAFGNAAGQYLPDFQLDEIPCTWLGQDRTVFVEVKPTSFGGVHHDEWTTLARRMCLVHTSWPDAVLGLAIPGYVGIAVPATRSDPYFAPAQWVLTGCDLVDDIDGGGWFGRVGIGLQLGSQPWDDEYWTAK